MQLTHLIYPGIDISISSVPDALGALGVSSVSGTRDGLGVSAADAQQRVADTNSLRGQAGQSRLMTHRYRRPRQTHHGVLPSTGISTFLLREFMNPMAS